MTPEEAVQWCAKHGVVVLFGNLVQIYNDTFKRKERNLLGIGDTLVAAVQKAIETTCISLNDQSTPEWMREEDE